MGIGADTSKQLGRVLRGGSELGGRAPWGSEWDRPPRGGAPCRPECGGNGPSPPRGSPCIPRPSIREGNAAARLRSKG